jgi:O-antigen chain-terminating methyltransferase
MSAAERIPTETTLEFMERIRNRIRDNAAKLDDVLPIRKQASLESGNGLKPGALAFSEDLRYLNAEHSFPTRCHPARGVKSHRGGLIGRAITAVKRKALSMVWSALEQELLVKWREYQAHLVRQLNLTATYVDERDAAIFWDLVRKIDADSERLDLLMREARGTLHTFQEHQNAHETEHRRALQQIQNAVHSLGSRLETVEKVARGVEATFQRLSSPPSVPPAREATIPDPRYVVFENRFRGSEAEIRERLTMYVELLSGSTLPVLDIGCGRGELLALLAEQKVTAYGVDMDSAMAALAVEKGLNVQLGDGIAHLASLADNSLGGIVAIQVVEHLPVKTLLAFLDQAYRVLAPGGVMAIETINPRSVSAMYSNYFRDPTHVFPVHPDTLEHLAVSAGFPSTELRELSPIPDSVKLLALEPMPFMTPQWKDVMARMNHNVSQLNGLLYGAQDYCLIARKS